MEDNHDPEVNFIVEPIERLRERYSLMMATPLVDLNVGPTCKVQVMNSFSSAVVLRQDAEIGKAERIDRLVSVIVES